MIANKDVENGMFLYCKFIKPFWKAIDNSYQFKCINCVILQILRFILRNKWNNYEKIYRYRTIDTYHSLLYNTMKNLEIINI